MFLEDGMAVQVYKVIFLLLMVLVLQCSAIHSCFSDEVCVPVRYCPYIWNDIQTEAVNRNRPWNEYRWCDQQSGEKLRVCCGQKNTSVGKRCLTAESQKGRCLDPEHCSIDGRYLRESMQRNAFYASDEDACYHSDADGKHFYCCPDAYINEPQKDQTPREREKRSLKVENAFPSCNRADGFSGHCVPMSLCDRFGALVLDRNPNFKYNESLPDAYKCPSDASDSTSMCCAYPQTPHDLIRHAKAKKLHPESCGLIGTPNLVLGGDEAGLGEFPWMAKLMGLRNSTKTAVCTGTLIHARYVLTAAHCAKFAEPVSVRLGEHILSTQEDCVENDCVKYVEYGIANYTRHEKFMGRPGLYDIALVKLNEPAEIIMDRVYPICLPVTHEWLMMKPIRLIASGWGVTEKGRDPKVLRLTNLQILKNRPYYCKQEQMICARGSNMETLSRGDGGGPLQQVVRYGEEYRMVQFGVIFGGTGKHTVNGSVEASILVGYHIKWILDNMDI